VGPIGVFDSGMGGLTVLRALNRRLPREDLVYFGDTARVPYGTKGARTVQAFAWQDAAFLVTQHVKMIVVACNTASAFALDYLRDQFAVPILGVIDPGVETALARTRGGTVGVIGTSGTIRSGRYQDGLARRIPRERILACECPLLVPLVEEGMLEHPVTDMVIAEYLGPMKQARVDTLILGCTHYPVLKAAIGRFMGPDVALVDSADALAEAAAAILAGEKPAAPTAEAVPIPEQPGKLTFFLSDIPWKFAEVGERFLGRPIQNVTTVDLDEFERAEGLTINGKDGA
jgi:glutamate racemase